MSDQVFSMHVSPKKVAAYLFVVALALTFVSGVAQFIGALLGAGRYPLLSLLFVGQDASVPSWFSAVLLLACSLLLGVIAHARTTAAGAYLLHWWGLSAIFLYLSIDEAISIHEKLSPLGGEMLRVVGAGGFVQRAWVVPAAIVLAVLTFLYARFFFRLPPRVRLLFLVALGLFFGNAVGLEVLNDVYVYLNGGVRDLSVVENMIRTIALPHVEEFGEMVGVIILLYALLLQAQERFGVLEFRIEK